MVMHPVVRRLSKTDFDIVEIDLENDVLCTFVERNVIKYQTETEVLSQIVTLEEQLRYLEKFGFKKAERGFLVNMNKAEWFDESTSQIYFQPYPARTPPAVPVSQAQKASITKSASKINGACQLKFNSLNN